MGIKNIRIENFRGVTDFHFDCAQNINVLVGINGAGKSTVLHAIDILMSWLVARLKNVNGKGYVLTDDDITFGRDFCCLEVVLDNGVSWKLYKQRSSLRTKPSDKTCLEKVTEFANQVIMENQKENAVNKIPLFASYGVSRVVDNTPARVNKKHALDMFDVYNKEMESKMNFQSFFNWFREREDLENEKLREVGKLVEDRQLKAVRLAVELALPGFKHLKVQRSPRCFTIEKNGSKIKFDVLSDGEKSYVVLVADIARKLSMTNSDIANPLNGTGIIIIDEIDLHLHPTWQREIVPQLRKVFPCCQFFISTHSPFVLSNVKQKVGDKLFLLRDGVAMPVMANIYGKRIDAILAEELELPSLRGKETQEHIDLVWNQLRSGKTDSCEFREGMDWLRANLDPSDSEFMQIAVQEKILGRRNTL